MVLDNAPPSAGRLRCSRYSRLLVIVTSRPCCRAWSAAIAARRLALRMLSEYDAVTLLHEVTTGYRADDDPGELTELALLCARLPLALPIAAKVGSRPFCRWPS